ncbi:MAG: hypothetical protein ABIQ30_13105 [Devosia sp.]
MAHSHYVIDLFYPEDHNPERFRREVLRIEAKDDAEAEAEGHRVSGWRLPAHFAVRSINTSSRGQERVIYDTRPDEAEAGKAAATAAPVETSA